MSQDEEKKLPHISVNAQYIKDLSFENPNAPESLEHRSEQPSVNISVDLDIKNLQDENYYEVSIIINSKVTSNDKTLFIVDLTYAGVFHLINVSKEQCEMMLSIHCPAIIFPYARKIIADATQDGGYQPLMIDPIDFGVLYSKKINQSRGYDD